MIELRFVFWSDIGEDQPESLSKVAYLVSSFVLHCTKELTIELIFLSKDNAYVFVA